MRIYEEHDIFIDFEPGERNALYIVFSDKLFSRSHNYRWKKEIKQSGQSGLFITQQEQLFFQSPNIPKILQKLESLLQKFKKIIVMGLGVAGYAALYFSKILKANIVFAISPMFTVDPKLTEGFDNRDLSIRQLVANYASPITQEAVFGQVYIFFDGTLQADAWHAEQISANIKCELVQLNFAGRNTLLFMEEANKYSLLFETKGDHAATFDAIAAIKTLYAEIAPSCASVISNKLSQATSRERAKYLATLPESKREILLNEHSLASFELHTATAFPGGGFFLSAETLIGKKLFLQAVAKYEKAILKTKHPYWLFRYSKNLSTIGNSSRAKELCQMACLAIERGSKEYLPVAADWFEWLGILSIRAADEKTRDMAFNKALYYSNGSRTYVHYLEKGTFNTLASCSGYANIIDQRWVTSFIQERMPDIQANNFTGCDSLANTAQHIWRPLKTRVKIKTNKNVIPKNVFIYWGQGFNRAPALVTKCLHSLEQHNPDANIIKLDDYNLSDFVDIPSFILKKKERGLISFAQFSDILRIHLLYSLGGVWTDATCFHTQPLDSHIATLGKNGFFVFKDADTISSWFIMSAPRHIIVAAMRQALMIYWRDMNCLVNYFLFHMIFRALTNIHTSLKAEIAKMPLVSRAIPHIMQRNMLKHVSDSTLQEIISCSFVHKLSYKFASENITQGCLLAKLMPELLIGMQKRSSFRRIGVEKR